MARSLNGTSDYIATASNPTTTTSDLSVGIWVLATSFPANEIYPIYNGNGASSGFGLFFPASTGILHFLFGGVRDQASGVAISLGVWHHILGVWISSSGTMLQYVDGVLANSISGIGAPHAATGQCLLGCASDITRFWPGSLADGTIWTAALTAAEASALFQGARPSQIRPLSLAFWMPLTGLQSPEPDLSGGKFNGTLNGAPAPAFGPPITAFTPRWPRSLLVSAGPTIILPFDVNMGQGYRQTRVVAY